jgi:pyruvate carboxylase
LWHQLAGGDPKAGEEVTIDIGPGRTLILRFVAVSEPHADATRTVFFELNGQPREIVVRDKSLRVAAPAHPKVNPSEPGHVGSPSPGVITNVFVQLSHKVGRGDKLLMLEAMKMQNVLRAERDGTVKKIHATPGATLAVDALILEFA